MRNWWTYGVGISTPVALALALGVGCGSTGADLLPEASVGDGGEEDGGGPPFVPPHTDASAGDGSLAACTTFSAEAKLAPAAMLIVLDRTASMSQLGKWAAARTAIVDAIDKDVFDTISLGMLTFPSPTSVPGPACIFNFPIYCAVSATPQVPIQAAGAAKSSAATGVRHDIREYLVANGPESADASDSSPIWAALHGAYSFIKTVPDVDKRVVVLITDGGGSCTSVATPARPAYTDNNGCQDWEQPRGMAELIAAAQTNATTPIETFVVGVPGSNSHGQQAGSYDTPPYSMLLALSTYAVAGSPSTVDPSCDKTLTFSQGGADPARPCHVDLSNGASFNADAVANAISAIRRNALGCVYNLPQPPSGQAIPPNEVNVVVTIDGTEHVVPKRQAKTDTCASDLCWDYDADGKVTLIGNACASVRTAAHAKVDIYAGCATIVK